MLPSAARRLAHDLVALQCALASSVPAGEHATTVLGRCCRFSSLYSQPDALSSQPSSSPPWSRQVSSLPLGTSIYKSILDSPFQRRSLSSAAELDPTAPTTSHPFEAPYLSELADMIAILQSVESYADMDSTITTFGNSITEQPLMVALERMKEIQVKCKASLRPDTSGVSEGVVLTRLSRLFAPMLPAMSSTSCVDILNSFATLNHNPGIDGPGLLELYAHIRNHKLKALQSEPVTVLVQLAWSMGRICRHGERPVDEELFAQLAGQIFPRINKLSIKELSMLAQAYADAGMYNWPLLDAVSSSAKKKLHDFDPAAAINIASSFARLKFNDSEFLDMLAEIMRGHMNILKGAQLAKLCKAFGSLKYSNEEFFQSASIALQRRMCDLNCEQVRNVAWAFAVRRHPDISLYNSLALRACQLINHFQPVTLCMLVWSFGKLGFNQPLLLQRSSAALTVFLQQDPFVAQALASPPPPVPSPPNPHSMGGLAPPPSHLPPKTLDQAIAVLTRAERGVSSSSLLSVKNTANMLWGYARVGFCDEALLKVVATRMKVLLKDPEGRIVDAVSAPGFERYIDCNRRLTVRYMSDEEEMLEVVLTSDGSIQQRPADTYQRLFISQNLSDMAWALAVAKHHDVELFEMIAARAMENAHMLGKTSIVDLATAFATTEIQHAALMSALEEAALALLPDFSPSYLSDTLWAFAVLQHQPSEEFLRLTLDLIWSRWERVTADHKSMAKIMWSLIKLGCDTRFATHPLMPALISTMESMQDTSSSSTSSTMEEGSTTDSTAAEGGGTAGSTATGGGGHY